MHKIPHYTSRLDDSVACLSISEQKTELFPHFQFRTQLMCADNFKIP